MTEPTYTITQAEMNTLLCSRLEDDAANLLRSLTPWARPVFGKPGTRDVDVAAAQAAWDATHPAPSTKPTPTQGEREAVIAELRDTAKGFNEKYDVSATAKICTNAADMLAADAQLEAERDGERKSRCEAWAKSEEAWRLVQSLQAQQVAQPQGWRLVPLVATELMRKLVVQSFYDELLAAAPRPPQAATPKPCTWTEDADGYYSTGCGECFAFNEGTPAQNKAYFCHHCGGKIEVAA